MEDLGGSGWGSGSVGGSGSGWLATTRKKKCSSFLIFLFSSSV